MITRSRFRGWKSDGLEKRGNINGNTGGRKRKDWLAKNNITRDVDASRGPIQTLVSFVHRTIDEENTQFGAEIKFVCIVLTEARPARATKNTQESIVGLLVEETKNR